VGEVDSRWHIAWIPLTFALALIGCKKREEQSHAPPRDARASRVIVARPIDAHAIDARAVDATIDAPSENDLRIDRVRAYLGLLVYDFWIYEALVSFPGAPPGKTFVANQYGWHVKDLLAPDALRAAIGQLVTLSARSPRTPTDDAVHAYVQTLAASLPALLDLRAYYDRAHFIDDEFDRARRETPDIARLSDQLAKLRVPMRAAILSSWQELSSDVPASPRAIVTTAWRKCLSVADPMMANAKKPAIEAAISACRRSIPTVSALPAKSGREFAEPLRHAAGEIGDAIANEYVARDLPGVLERFTDDYLALWPTLPNTPPERE